MSHGTPTVTNLQAVRPVPDIYGRTRTKKEDSHSLYVGVLQYLLLYVVRRWCGGTERQLNAVAAAAAVDVNDADEPSFRPAPTNITVSPGDHVALKCRVDNLGTKTVCRLLSHCKTVQQC